MRILKSNKIFLIIILLIININKSFANNLRHLNNELLTNSSSSNSSSNLLCNNNFDCNNHGQCNIENGICYCDDGYINKFCDYKQKSRTIALLLQIFIGWSGASDYYIERLKTQTLISETGFIKTFLISIICPIICCCIALIPTISNLTNQEKKDIIFMIPKLILIIIHLWWLIDIFMFAFVYKDGNNKPLTWLIQ